MKRRVVVLPIFRELRNGVRSNRAYNEDELGVMTRVVTATRAVATDILRGFLVLTRALVEVVIVR